MNRAWARRRANQRTVMMVARIMGGDSRSHRMIRQILGPRSRRALARRQVEAWIAAGRPPF